MSDFFTRFENTAGPPGAWKLPLSPGAQIAEFMRRMRYRVLPFKRSTVDCILRQLDSQNLVTLGSGISRNYWLSVF